LKPSRTDADPVCTCSCGARLWEWAHGVGGAWARLWAVVCGSVRGVICHRPPPFFDSCFSFFRGRLIFFLGGGWPDFLVFGGLFVWEKQEVVPRAGLVPRNGWQAALSARAAPVWPCTCSSAGRGRRAWIPPAGRAWCALPRRVLWPRRMRERGPLRLGTCRVWYRCVLWPPLRFHVTHGVSGSEKQGGWGGTDHGMGLVCPVVWGQVE
jgi:hypothetical protein